MISLANRSPEKELLDRDDIPFSDIRQNMKELNFINTYLGGHKITLDGIAALGPETNTDELIICEIGCGGGDNLSTVATWFQKKKIPARFIGIDIKKECIAFAGRQYPKLPASWIVSDYSKVEFTSKPDIIFSSLFCHHFHDAELVTMLQWMHTNCNKGFFINDLHRNKAAYIAIKGLTGLFSQSYLVKHDAPLSVARGFKKEEWKRLLEKAKLDNYKITWKWAFRHLITCYK